MPALRGGSVGEGVVGWGGVGNGHEGAERARVATADHSVTTTATSSWVS